MCLHEYTDGWKNKRMGRGAGQADRWTNGYVSIWVKGCTPSQTIVGMISKLLNHLFLTRKILSEVEEMAKFR